MSDEQGTVFLDGLRVTSQHLNHLEESAQQAVTDLRRVLGLAHVGYGFRIQVAADGQSATLTPGLGFTASGARVTLDEGATLTIPAGDGPFSVALTASTHDDPTTRVGDTGTIIYSDTAVSVAAGAPPGPDSLVVGTIARSAGSLTATQDGALFLAPANHGHSGGFYQDGAGIWRYDGPLLSQTNETAGPAGPPGPVGAAGPQGPAGPEGLAGPQGPAGATGPAGPAGPQGDAGPAGPQGSPGPAGPDGGTGPAGPIGFTGPAGNPGPAGPAGADGQTGPQGSPGATGPAGPAGADGQQGPAGGAGPAGPQGPAGPPGQTGPPGATGGTGAQGPAGATGATGPQGPPGLLWRGAWSAAAAYAVDDVVSDQGSSYVRIVAGSTATPPGTDSTNWQEVAAAGAAGSTGPPGQAGPQGTTGPAGPQGQPGEAGPPGPPGQTGPAGATGGTGAQGPAGATGATGSPGPPGPPGPQGPEAGLNLTTVKAVNWNPRTAIPFAEAVKTLSPLEIEFTAALGPGTPFLAGAMWVRLVPTATATVAAPTLSPVLALHGTTTIQNTLVIWQLADPTATVQNALRNGGLILVDLDCDYIVDANGADVSGSAGIMAGQQPPVRPGGIFRTWIQVSAG
jgi:hypothetical protein